MIVLIVVDSLHGNTERIARTIAEEFAPYHPVRVARPHELERLPYEMDFLVVGSPTQRHSVPPAIRTFLQSLTPGSQPELPAAAFDTRYRMPRLLSGAASDPVARRLRRLGCRLVLPPESFFVAGREGPLETGELARAAAWARRLREAASEVDAG